MPQAAIFDIDGTLVDSVDLETVSNLGGGMGQAKNGRSGEWDEVARHGGVDRERWLRLRTRSQRGG